MCDSVGEGRLSPWTVSDLTTAERALLTGFRQWFRHGTAGGMAAMRASFGVAGVPSSALLPLFALLGTFAVTNASRPAFRCPSCSRVGMDEMAVLDALAAMQAGEGDVTTQVFDRWLPLVALTMAADSARELADILDSARIRLPRRRPARLIALAAE
ncbi:hypothetical protein GAY28_09735 [Azospirillum brasilense]|uniref:hypothetical protein n=1 Tax=Azospirillum brasilense TaxID=192 RepID=UPI000E6A3842|nr:hypothetical protein [Azospirillum brasilense]NUB12966.1 hypothetical protein [Azospirillum brasilense]NUB25378.1 hypothetical protein [Azospirillum brasilense]NUB32448.1 hypothetical protein [Azospirillum brasilense]RIW01094.1 hypothetical protein D2T81_19335 [Azospirillum brasilense]